MSFLPIVLMFGVLYMVMIRPQQTRAREHRDLVTSIASGDEIVTTAGIFGVVSEVEDDVIWLEVAQGLELKVLKGTVDRRFVEAESDEPEGTDEAESPIED